MTICTQCGRENRASARFCDSCASPLGGEPKLVDEVRKTVTAVFCDVVGSTPLAERLDPEVLRRVMGRYFDAMRGAVEGHGGRVEKFIGDAVVGVFGVPRVREDDALRAVRAVDDMRTRLVELNASLMAEWGVELEARIGICTGEVVVGAGDVVMLGDVGNTAARLEQAASGGEVLISDDTYRLVRHAVTAEPAGVPELKGKRLRTAVWRLGAVDARAGMVVREFGRPLVGRTHELGLLREAFDRAVATSRGGLATVFGFPGIGKSRLALGLAESLAGEACVLVGHCRSYGEGITYWPVAEMVREAVGESIRSGLASLLDGEPDGHRVARVVTAALGEAETTGGGEETFWAVRRVFEALAAEQPLVLVFEDIHWAEPTLLDLIEYLASRTRERPILVVCLARLELLENRPGWSGGQPNAVSLLLESLSESDAQQMLQERLEGRVIAPEVRARIVHSAEGVPLFLEQMLAMMDEYRAISAEDVPPAISALLASRLESLDDVDRGLLEQASVEGERFHAGTLAALAGEDRDHVLLRLDGLVDRELIRPDEADLPSELGFRFAHALIRDAAYEHLPKTERAALHHQLAERLEDHGVGEELLGYHFEHAYQLDVELALPDERARALARRASELLATAGRRAHGRDDYGAAVSLLQRAADLLPPDDPRRVALLPELGMLLCEVDVPRASPVLTEAIERARSTDDPRVEWESIVINSRALLYRDPTARPLAEVLSEAERASRELEALGDKRGLASALILRGDVHWMLGQVARCRELGAAAAELGQGGVKARALSYAAGALSAGDLPVDQAEARCLELLQRSGENRTGRANVLAELGVVQAMQGRIDEGRTTVRAARDTLDDLAISEWKGIATLSCGYVELLAGDVRAAEQEFARAEDTFTALGDAWFLSTAVVDRGLALCALGHHAQAVRLCTQPEAPYDSEWVIKWNQVQCLAHAAAGSLELARSHADTAVDAAEATEYQTFHAAALAIRASVHDQLSRTSAALADLEAALALYRQKGNVVEARRISERLAGRA